MDAEEIDLAKSLMWDYGLTRCEAVAYVLHTERGLSKAEIGRLTGRSRPSASRLVKSASIKIEVGHHGKEEHQGTSTGPCIED